MAENKIYLSKVQLGDSLYYIKDTEAQEVIAQLKAAAYKDVAASVSADEQGLVTGAQVQTAIANLTGAMHFKGVVDALPSTAEDGDVYIVGVKEYVYANSEFHELGDESIYALKSTTVAGLALSANISVEALQNALGLGALAYKSSASGTVAGQTITGVKATGTTTGSIDVALDQTSTAATLATTSYKPEGSVEGTTTAKGSVSIAANEDGFQVTGTVSAPSITVTPSTTSVTGIDDVGSQASYSQGKFSAGSLPTYKQGDKAAWSASVSDETLSFSFTANGDDTFTQGSLPSHDEDQFTANDLPTKATATTVVTGISEAKASAPSFTGGKIGASFEGASSDITATFSGIEKANAIVTGVNYDKATVNATDTKFTGAAIELSVGDITVAAKDVTVN